jgi:hypothetical protein
MVSSMWTEDSKGRRQDTPGKMEKETITGGLESTRNSNVTKSSNNILDYK